ncbi:heavy metal translocating P-type ATPase [Brevibacillus sp. B_LB10_24]|uniref:heavy metal translocating P-type ATPase n=1 Tax=Brevibacillus sp. B_LB10_24 TaxID=3380645 RepID=UPI0038B72A10
MGISRQITLHISGMTCAACANRIEKVLRKVNGVNTVQVNLAIEKAMISYQPDVINQADIAGRIEKLGYKATEEQEDKHLHEIGRLKKKCLISTLLSIPLIWSMVSHFPFAASSVWVPALFENAFFQLAITFPIQFWIGFSFYEGAWRALKNRSANMDLLVVLSTSSAFFYSHYLTLQSIGSPSRHVTLYFETSAVIITFLLIGKLLEATAKGRTVQAIKSLYQLQPKSAVILRGGEQLTIPIEQLAAGDIFIVMPGERVATDGIVIRGSSTLDESMITGESIPVEKLEGSFVIGATLNQNGMLHVKAVKIGGETALSQIIKVVEEAQSKKAPIQRYADELTEIFVPLVVTIAAITFLAWYFLLHPGDFGDSLEKAMAVLIIACPCALGLATPTSILVASGRGARSGILFKRGEHLETLQKVDTVVLDKTGTVTKGEPEITDVYCQGETSKFLQFVAAAETGSPHPFAAAIVQTAAKRNLPTLRAAESHTVPGYGIKAVVEGKQVIIGSEKLMIMEGVTREGTESLVNQLQSAGKTVLYVAVDRQPAGLLAAADTVKEGAREVVYRLKKMGKEVIMVTGDHQFASTAVAQKIGISRVYAGMLPEEKAALIERWRQQGKTIAMVGDGINDAPALTASDVGIALGTGTDIAIEAADVIIMQGDMGAISDAIRLSQKTIANIKQNMFWALAYNSLGIPLTMLGYLSPWLAGAAMALSSISVVLNSLRLKRVRL